MIHDTYKKNYFNYLHFDFDTILMIMHTNKLNTSIFHTYKYNEANTAAYVHSMTKLFVTAISSIMIIYDI